MNGNGNRLKVCTISLALSLTWLGAATLYAGTPVPSYGSYFGGSGDINVAVAVAVGPSGEVIVAGYTTSQSLPGTANALQPTRATGFPNNRDVFVAKFDTSGTRLQWATFLGGAGDDEPTAVAVDPVGSIYVIGTASSNFPVTPGAYDRSYSQNRVNGFAAKISADGHSLLYSTYLVGTPNAFAVNNAGEAYMVGPLEFTVITPGALGTGATGSTAGGGVSLLRLNSTGTAIVFGAYLGGIGFNGSAATSVALSTQGNVYVAGFTAESNIQTTANAYQRQYSNPGTGIPCCSNGFLVEVNPTATQLLYGTYFGPQYSGTTIISISVATDGSVLFSGTTNATIQASSGAYLSNPSGGFVAKLTLGSLVLDSFSYIDTFRAGPVGASLPSTPYLMMIGNQPQAAYVVFAAKQGGYSLVELSIPTLSLVSSPSAIGFGPLGLALSGPHSLWLVGLCNSCGNLVSDNAFQVKPQSTGENGFLLQLTDISPNISFVGSSATGTSPFAAGQLVSIYGMQLGPSPGGGAQIGPDGSVTKSNGGTQVLFDGVSAPILYAGDNQVNAAVPCSLAGKSSTQLVVRYLGAQSASFTVPLSAAAPGIFTVNGSGIGQGAVLNQDYSLNGPGNPAPRGSAVAIYATGVPTSPCIDGLIYQANFPSAALPLVVGVANVGAQVLYDGQAPGLITGVAQINIVVPNDVAVGVVPLVLLVGGVVSPQGVTIAVK